MDRTLVRIESKLDGQLAKIKQELLATGCEISAFWCDDDNDITAVKVTKGTEEALRRLIKSFEWMEEVALESSMKNLTDLVSVLQDKGQISGLCIEQSGFGGVGRLIRCVPVVRRLYNRQYDMSRLAGHLFSPGEHFRRIRLFGLSELTDAQVGQIARRLGSYASLEIINCPKITGRVAQLHRGVDTLHLEGCSNIKELRFRSSPPQKIVVKALDQLERIAVAKWSKIKLKVRGVLPRLQFIKLYGCGLKSFDFNPSYLPALTDLNLRANRLKELPSAILRLPRLRRLNIYANELRTLPPQLVRRRGLLIYATAQRWWGNSGKRVSPPKSYFKCPHLVTGDELLMRKYVKGALPPVLRMLDSEELKTLLVEEHKLEFGEKAGDEVASRFKLIGRGVQVGVTLAAVSNPVGWLATAANVAWAMVANFLIGKTASILPNGMAKWQAEEVMKVSAARKKRLLEKITFLENRMLRLKLSYQYGTDWQKRLSVKIRKKGKSSRAQAKYDELTETLINYQVESVLLGKLRTSLTKRCRGLGESGGWAKLFGSATTWVGDFLRKKGSKS